MPNGWASEGMGASPRVLAVCPAALRGGGDVTDQVIEKPAGQSVESVDELGPVDWLVVESLGGRFTGEIAPTSDALVDNGTSPRPSSRAAIEADEEGD
jgi:hypothetical protein